MKPDKKYTWTIDTFQKVFEYNISNTSTYVEAYEITENEHKEDCGVPKYSNYDSFRVCRHHYIKKGK